MKPKAPSKNAGPRKPTRLSKARLDEMIEGATVDAHGESEQATGWFTMFEEHLDLPFETQVLGATVTVTGIDLRGDDQICTRGRSTRTHRHIRTFSGFLLRCIRSNSDRSGADNFSPKNRFVFTLRYRSNLDPDRKLFVIPTRRARH